MAATKSHGPSRTAKSAFFAVGTVAVIGTAAALAKRKKGREMSDDSITDDAPSWTRRDRPEGDKGPLIGRSVTINRPRIELYQKWRNFTDFPSFMENVEAVSAEGETSRWTIKAPAGSKVELVTEITHDVPGERIAWRSTAESQITTAGEVMFEEAAPGRGTIVRLVQAYEPPAGAIGKLVAKLFQREPNIQSRRDLRRFKQLMETGEVTTNASPSGRSSESPTESRI